MGRVAEMRIRAAAARVHIMLVMLIVTFCLVWVFLDAQPETRLFVSIVWIAWMAPGLALWRRLGVAGLHWGALSLSLIALLSDFRLDGGDTFWLGFWFGYWLPAGLASGASVIRGWATTPSWLRVLMVIYWPVIFLLALVPYLW